jgi:hypothetical protein
MRMALLFADMVVFVSSFACMFQLDNEEEDDEDFGEIEADAALHAHRRNSNARQHANNADHTNNGSASGSNSGGGSSNDGNNNASSSTGNTLGIVSKSGSSMSLLGKAKTNSGLSAVYEHENENNSDEDDDDDGDCLENMSDDDMIAGAFDAGDVFGGFKTKPKADKSKGDDSDEEMDEDEDDDCDYDGEVSIFVRGGIVICGPCVDELAALRYLLVKL